MVDGNFKQSQNRSNIIENCSTQCSNDFNNVASNLECLINTLVSFKNMGLIHAKIPANDKIN